MPYEFYKVLHFLGLFLTLSGLFGYLAVIWNRSEPRPPLRKLWMVTHGVGLVFMLVSGFGLAARLGLVRGLPLWVLLKIAVWVCVGALIALVKRRQTQAPLWYGLGLALVLTAALLAVTKPGA